MANASTTAANGQKAGAADGQKAGESPVVIKKYANRRLYNTESSSYITLDHLATMTRQGRDFQVFDARSGEDITRSVLTQIVMEEEAGGQTMLPVPFLRQIISMYGDSMQGMVPHYLEASMAAFTENQNKIRDAALKPFEQIAKQNLALFQAATTMLGNKKPAASAAPVAKETEVAELKAQLAALQARLDGIAEG